MRLLGYRTIVHDSVVSGTRISGMSCLLSSHPNAFGRAGERGGITAYLYSLRGLLDSPQRNLLSLCFLFSRVTPRDCRNSIQLDQDGFLPNPFQFIIHLLSY
jgi:hypothetical protein